MSVRYLPEGNHSEEKEASSIAKSCDLDVQARMTLLPVATINAMPSRTPKEAYSFASFGLIKCISVRGHLEGRLAKLWRCTGLCCSTTRHLEPRLSRLPRIESGRRYGEDEWQMTHGMVEFKSIRRVREGERDAAKMVDSIWGANNDSLQTHTEA